jgi:hypothetical protein
LLFARLGGILWKSKQRRGSFSIRSYRHPIIAGVGQGQRVSSRHVYGGRSRVGTAALCSCRRSQLIQPCLAFAFILRHSALHWWCHHHHSSISSSAPPPTSLTHQSLHYISCRSTNTLTTQQHRPLYDFVFSPRTFWLILHTPRLSPLHTTWRSSTQGTRSQSPNQEDILWWATSATSTPISPQHHS